ncbi:MAG: hypothetical protein N2109_07610 [Fimbriimonadales bacterium]|nr:hypothetical protein [Fimbriimonadales bacterium]
MNVPPFIPEPIEIPGNVAEQSRRACLRFVRRTVAFHALSALLIALVACVPLRWLPAEAPGVGALATLVALSAVRNLAKGYPADLRISVLLAPFLWVMLGLTAGALARQGWPVWAPLVGVGCSLLYTLLSGRDHSFVGQYVLSLAASSLAIALICREAGIGRPASLWAQALNAGCLFYLVYDLAAVLTRRLPKEEWGAVVDLYRDVLNFLTYSLRVWHHWRKHRIWSATK